MDFRIVNTLVQLVVKVVRVYSVVTRRVFSIQLAVFAPNSQNRRISYVGL